MKNVWAAGSYDQSIRIWDTEAFTWEVDESLAACGLLGPDRIPLSVPDDGWIRTPEGGLLLWIPDEHRVRVCDVSSFCISANETREPIRILWDKLCHGERWTEIHSGAQ